MDETMKTNKLASRLAWTLCALITLGAVGAAVVELRSQPAGANFRDYLSVINTVVTFAVFAVFAVVGALIIARQPRNVVGWLLMFEAAIVFFSPVDTYFSSFAQAPPHPTALTYLGLWLYMWGWIWYIFPILFIPLFFPTGRLLSPRWRWVVILGLGLCLYIIFDVTFGMSFKQTNDLWSVPNPIGFLPAESFPMGLFGAALLSFAALCVASIVIRFRRAQGQERQQMKWLLFAAGIFAAGYSIGWILNYASVNSGSLVKVVGFITNPVLLPIAIGIAILRYRLYDIDVIIRKTLVYALITALLALVYFGVVVLLQAVFESASGEQSPIAIVISTLIIAALFAPLRRRVQDLIDRRFYRRRYDAQQVLAQFAATARDETELDGLTAELLQVVQETMQPEGLAIWLPPTARGSRS